jgi:lysozyme
MTPSPRCLALIQEFEDCLLKAYKDGGGVWTIGWGTTVYPTGAKVKRGDVITQAQADAYFMRDVSIKSVAVDNLTAGVRLKHQQYDALVSFTYNVGSHALKTSTLLRLLRVNPNDPAIRTQFMRWNKDNGKVVGGLTRRRKAEADLYFI